VSAAATLLLLLGFPREAFLGRIVFKDVSLEQVAATAPLIVQAKYRADIQSEDQRGVLAFDIEGVWTAHTPVPATGDRIRVWQTSAEAWGGVMRFAQGGRATRSPLVNALRRERLLAPDTVYVLFLHNGVQPGEYVLQAQNAFILPEAFAGVSSNLPALRWRGVAENAKAGAIVEVDPLGSIYLDSLDRWPRELVRKHVFVTGLLVRKKYIPDGSAVSAGAEGLQWVIERPDWSL
jgi:hypothetical protein